MHTSDFDFVIPPELIAQAPSAERDASRLFVLHRASGAFEHRAFRDVLEYLCPGDVLVLNDSRVIPARLRGLNARTGGQFEMLLLEATARNEWWVMLRPGKRARAGTRIALRDAKGAATDLEATVLDKNPEGHCRLRFAGTADILDLLEALGEVPLPPYIERKRLTDLDLDRQRYQTVFANPGGSVAAPTAGLHFTEALLERVRQKGVEVCFLTLHVGLGTFAPVKTQSLAGHIMHKERYAISQQTAAAINRARAAGGRVVAVGTTTVRVLETIAGQAAGPLGATSGRTRIFIRPPYNFKIVDVLLTNFHLPRSTLVMLVSAFVDPGGTGGRERVLCAYAEAIRNCYRFLSYGDAMLIL